MRAFNIGLGIIAAMALATTPFTDMPKSDSMLLQEAGLRVAPFPTAAKVAPSLVADRRETRHLRELDAIWRRNRRAMTAHKNRAPGERAHRRWRKARSSGRKAV